MMIRTLSCAAIALFVFTIAANGIIPRTINYQGVLTDAGGLAVPDGTYSMTFRLYDVLSGGSPLWEETQGSITVTKGIFNVTLGSVALLDLPFDEQYFLGISVEGEAELTPRIYLDAAAYSLATRSLYGSSNIIPADGFVGIGTLLPNDPLTVESNDPVGIRFNGSAPAWAGIYTNATQSSGRPQFGYSREYFLKANTYVDIDDSWKLDVNGTSCITVTPSGDVGIGTTTPTEKLDIAGGIKLGTTPNTNAGTVRFSGGDFEGYDGSTWKSFTAGGGSGLPAGSAGQTLRHNGSDWIATSNLYNSGTSIGIGTTSPGRDLHVYRDANSVAGITIENPNAGISAVERISFIGSSGDVAALAVYGSGHTAYPNEMHLFNNRTGGLLELSAGSAGITMLENGSIGVNKTNPAATLDVAGGNWDLDGTNGDVRIGDDAYRLKIGVATDGLGAGTAGIRVQGGEQKLILGAGSAEVLSIDSNGLVDIGSDTQTGELNVYRSGSSSEVAELTSSAYGGEIQVYEENGTCYAALEPDYNGSGGYLSIRRNSSLNGFRVDGNFNDTGNANVAIFGSTMSAVFDMSSADDNSVSLPNNAISSVEMSDEPGVASQTYSGASIYLTGGVDMLMSRSIVVPASGYVLVIGTLNAWASHSNGTTSYADFGVSDNSGALPDNQAVTLQVSSGAGSGIYYFPVTVHGLFSVSAGTRNFYVLGDEGSGDMSAREMQLSLIYIPTAYGTVSPTLSSGQPTGDEGDATRPPMTAAEVEAQRTESEAFNAARIERELTEMRARLEALERMEQKNGQR
jgi:hypothetical protein